MQLDRDASATLYEQIAARLRYEIVTGQRATGERLPSLRAAADQWGVNLHTVRKAYHELARAGLVHIGTRGVRVVPLGPGAEPERDDVEALVREFVDEVARRFGMDAPELAQMFVDLARSERSTVHACSVIECSRSLSQNLAAEVSAQYDVNVTPVDIHDDVVLGEGPIIGTYFHADDLKARINDRSGQLHLVRIRPRLDPISSRCDQARDGVVRRVIVIDRLPGSAHDLATDFRLSLEEAVAIEIRILSDPLLAFPPAVDGTVVVASPQTWDRLTPALRSRPDVVELQYSIDVDDLTALAGSLGWERR